MARKTASTAPPGEAAFLTYKAPKPRSTMRVRLDPKHGKMMPKGVQVGKKHKFTVHGKVTGVSSDEYGHSIEMDVGGLADAATPVNQAEETESGEEMNNTDSEPNSLTGALRKRHSQTGRFVA